MLLVCCHHPLHCLFTLWRCTRIKEIRPASSQCISSQPGWEVEKHASSWSKRWYIKENSGQICRTIRWRVLYGLISTNSVIFISNILELFKGTQCSPRGNIARQWNGCFETWSSAFAQSVGSKAQGKLNCIFLLTSPFFTSWYVYCWLCLLYIYRFMNEMYAFWTPYTAASW